MIDPTGRVDSMISTQLRKVYKSVSAASIRQIPKADSINISEFSALVKDTQTKALSKPSIRLNRVLEVQQKLLTSGLPSGTDIANTMVDGNSEGI
jgi:hypothetical protein